MNNQKRVIEMFLYLTLLCVFIFLSLTNFEVELFKDKSTIEQSEEEQPYLDEVPEEFISDSFVFEVD